MCMTMFLFLLFLGLCNGLWVARKRFRCWKEPIIPGGGSIIGLGIDACTFLSDLARHSRDPTVSLIANITNDTNTFFEVTFSFDLSDLLCPVAPNLVTVVTLRYQIDLPLLDGGLRKSDGCLGKESLNDNNNVITSTICRNRISSVRRSTRRSSLFRGFEAISSDTGG